jgi:Tol biopolymer transport system component
MFFSAMWSPDGSRILTVRDEYASTQEGNPLWLAVMDADGSNERVLVRGFLSQPQWSPDGSQIFYYADGAVHVVDVTDGRAQDVLDSVDPQGLSVFAVSPDGTRILYTQPIDQDQGEQLWVAGVDGGDPHPVAEGLEWREPSPTWSPDGTSIAFVRDGDIWTIDLRTGEEHQVTDSPEHETLPVWGQA